MQDQIAELTPVRTSVVEGGTAKGNAGSKPVAVVETDRFCENCAYNLRTLPVYRDERTGIPVVRCTECGRYQAANDAAAVFRPWLDRLTSVVLGVWVLAGLSGLLLLFVAEGSLSYATLDELTIPGGYQIVQRSGTTTTYKWTGRSGPREIHPDVGEFRLVVGAFLAASVSLAFAVAVYMVVLFPHWPRLVYLGLVLTGPLIGSGMVLTGWRYDAPHLFAWAVPLVGAHCAMQVIGGVAGVRFGRAVARGVVCCALPPSLRPRLAYLWLADGKPFPGTRIAPAGA